jgi:hypothetical protein
MSKYTLLKQAELAASICKQLCKHSQLQIQRLKCTWQRERETEEDSVLTLK